MALESASGPRNLCPRKICLAYFPPRSRNALAAPLLRGKSPICDSAVRSGNSPSSAWFRNRSPRESAWQVFRLQIKLFQPVRARSVRIRTPPCLPRKISAGPSPVPREGETEFAANKRRFGVVRQHIRIAPCADAIAALLSVHPGAQQIVD